MRARRLPWGILVVVAYALLLVGAAVDAWRDREPDRAAPLRDPVAEHDQAAAADLVAAWERQRTGTYVATGTYERRRPATGAELRSEDVLAQDPPRRLHRQLGGVTGRHNDRLVACPAPPPGAEARPCELGPPGGTTYAESVTEEVDALRALVLGPDPLYRVTRDGEACFRLDQVRVDPRAPFGFEATFCFDDATGALVRSLVRHDSGVVEERVVTEARAEVTEADLTP